MQIDWRPPVKISDEMSSFMDHSTSQGGLPRACPHQPHASVFMQLTPQNGTAQLSSPIGLPHLTGSNLRAEAYLTRLCSPSTWPWAWPIQGFSAH